MVIGRAAAALVIAAACQPPDDRPPWLVDSPRVLAVRGEPAESIPGEVVRYRAYVAPDAAGVELPSWSFCATPKPPEEDNTVAAACITTPTAAFGAGFSVTATIPAGACRSFGPDSPGEGLRPRDPDATGGYYQPVRVDFAGTAAFHLHRIRCALPLAPPDVARQFAERAHPNTNPELAARAPSVEVPPNDELTLSASWPDGTEETYPVYDPVTQSLVDRRESLRISWFTTAGELSSGRWRAPDTPQTATLWVVARDGRGGVSVQTLSAEVR